MRTLPIVMFVVACSGSAKQTNLPTAPPSPVVSEPTGPVALEPPQPKLRLPKNFVPTGYTAKLAIDPSAKGFDGTIAIAGKVSERSSVIWLHGYHLTIKHATAGNIALTVTPHGEDLLELRAATPIEAGDVSINIDYSGVYDEVNTAGAFKQTVNDKPYVFTQFEALYARRVFPCVDEPDNKVPWQLTLDVPEKLVAVSNTPALHEQAANGHKHIEFARTKPLSSYLIAFGVGPFEIVDGGKTKSGTPVRVVTLAGRAEEATWAAKTTARIIDLEEEFFGTKYPYEKMDMLTIPLTVGFGAMENAGLITFTETLMLMDAKHPAKDRQYTWVVVAAHELAHQWFGDLVTTAFWDDIWLNEGFANWVERKVSAKFDASWHDELAEVGTRDEALDADSLVSARQIRQPIETQGDVLNAFDGITYDKGASVLNMFESYLGSDVFMTGVRQYLEDHKWGSATSTDFAKAISKASGKDVNAAFATFLEQPGAPEITATLACDKGQPPRVDLAQHRYVPVGAPTPSATKPWIVPVCVAFDAGGKRGETCTLLDQPTGSIALTTKSCPRWMMPNLDGRGYYRNSYTTSQAVALRDEAWSQLKWTERRVLFFDTSDAASQGKTPFALALSFVPKLLVGNDRFTTGSAIQLPVSVDRFVPDELRNKYEYWIRQAFGPGAAKVGLVTKDSDSLDVETTRDQLVYAAAKVARDPVLVGDAVKLAEHYRDLPQSIRESVISLAVDASPEAFDRILKDVYTDTDRARRDEMLGALGSVRDVSRQKKVLALILDPKLDIRETIFTTFRARYDQNIIAASEFFRDNKDAIMKRLPDEGTVGSLARLGFLFTKICLPQKHDEVEDYVNKTFSKLAGGERVVRQEVEEMDQCIARRKLLEPEIRAWLTGIKVQKPKK